MSRTREAEITMDVTLTLTVKGTHVRGVAMSYEPPLPPEPEHCEDVEFIGPDGQPVPQWLYDFIMESDGDEYAQEALLEN